MSFPSTTPAALIAVFVSGVGMWVGAEIVIHRARLIARLLRLPELVIGLTVISIGSSLPEIFLNIAAGRANAPTVGIGSVIGSCFGQITIILGLCVLLGGTATVSLQSLKRDGTILIGCILLMMLLGADGHYSRYEGLFTVALYLTYLAYLINTGAKDAVPAWMHRKRPPQHRYLALTAGMFLMGLVIVYVSAEVLVREGSILGHRFGFPEIFIGMMTGLLAATPELAVSLVALKQRSSALSLGNLIGSNITDPLFSLGIGTIIGNYTFDFAPFLPPFLFWLLGTALALYVMWTGLKVTRWDALLLVSVYLAYLWMTLGGG